MVKSHNLLDLVAIGLKLSLAQKLEAAVAAAAQLKPENDAVVRSVLQEWCPTPEAARRQVHQDL